jgi:hypothetical protein
MMIPRHSANIHICAYKYINMYIYIYLYYNIYIYIYIYIYKQNCRLGNVLLLSTNFEALNLKPKLYFDVSVDDLFILYGQYLIWRVMFIFGG